MTAKPKGSSDEQVGQTSRRDMLKRTATATAAMGVVGTAATSNASAKQDCDTGAANCPECTPDDCDGDECEVCATWSMQFGEVVWDCSCEPVDDGGGGGGFLFY